MQKVKIYSTPTCVYCNMAKQFFKEKGVKYEEYDVAADLKKRKEMVDISGQMGVPVIVIGEDVMVGFDKQALSMSLGIK